ncbi:MAG: TIGR04282 family arsenosugar biosynthesis glycosyltransferase [Pseudomonadota bacterium]
MRRGAVIIFAKAPVAGRVKTRLAAGVGTGRATALFRLLIDQTMSEARRGAWKTILAVDPPAAVGEAGRFFPAEVPRIAQGPGDLGARMARVFQAAPPGPVLIIGADAPGLRARHLCAAFQALAGADAVFGPAEDGGYWLIGLARRRPAPKLFEGVRWSTPFALHDTLQTLPRHFRVAHLEALADIDEAADLSRWRPRTLAR